MKILPKANPIRDLNVEGEKEEEAVVWEDKTGSGEEINI
jgi:hypothetical protein